MKNLEKYVLFLYALSLPFLGCKPGENYSQKTTKNANISMSQATLFSSEKEEIEQIIDGLNLALREANPEKYKQYCSKYYSSILYDSPSSWEAYKRMNPRVIEKKFLKKNSEKSITYKVTVQSYTILGNVETKEMQYNFIKEDGKWKFDGESIIQFK